MKTLTTRLDLKAYIEFVNTVGLGTIKLEPPGDWTQRLADGDGDNEADVAYMNQRTLNTTSETLDLTGGLDDAFGDAITFASIKLMMLMNNAEATGNLTVGGAASNPWAAWAADTSDKIVIPPQGILTLLTPLSGWTVTDASADQLKIETSADMTYDIILVGVRA